MSDLLADLASGELAELCTAMEQALADVHPRRIVRAVHPSYDDLDGHAAVYADLMDLQADLWQACRAAGEERYVR